MSQKGLEGKWHIAGASCRGANHIRSNLVNQDAISWPVSCPASYPFILAVADGHGSAKSFRSHRGAQIAVRIANDVLSDLYFGNPDAIPQFSSFKDTCEHRVPDALVARWRKRVLEDIAKEPIAEEELRLLEEKDGHNSRTLVTDSEGILAYGTTLLAVLIAEEYALYIQLGDGDIFTVAEDGSVSRPLSGDSRLFANETTSLCQKNAHLDFRVAFRLFGNTPPALIFLSTDGYANSYPNDEAFLKVPADYLNQIQTHGLHLVESELGGWLDEVSKGGSGDDITLGLLWRESVPIMQKDNVALNSPPEPLTDDKMTELSMVSETGHIKDSGGP